MLELGRALRASHLMVGKILIPEIKSLIEARDFARSAKFSANGRRPTWPK